VGIFVTGVENTPTDRAAIQNQFTFAPSLGASYEPSRGRAVALARDSPFLPFSGRHVWAPSDIAGSGGAPRQATTRETEARSVPEFLARIVNTEGPGP